MSISMNIKLKAVKQNFLKKFLNVKHSLGFSEGGIVPSKTPDKFKLPIRGERMYKITKCTRCDNPTYQRDGKIHKLCAICGWKALKELCELNEIEEV